MVLVNRGFAEDAMQLPEGLARAQVNPMSRLALTTGADHPDILFKTLLEDFASSTQEGMI